MTEDTHRTANIRIDADQMRELVGVGIRRACAFVRLGPDGLEDRDGGDFNLSASLAYQFWPTEISAQHREAAREEYRAWLIGSCLRELDLFYGLFLDRVWWAIDAAERHGTAVPSDYVLGGRFNRDTNVAKKHRRVAEKLGTADHFDQLNSLSLARNALTHNAGVVRSPTDCNGAARDRLEIRWLAYDMIAERDGIEIVVERAPLDMHEHFPGEGAVMLAVRFTERQIEIPAGQKIALTHANLAELCMFYKIMTDKVLSGFADLLRARGQLRESPGQEPATDCE